jgi:hypothetical protein
MIDGKDYSLRLRDARAVVQSNDLADIYFNGTLDAHSIKQGVDRGCRPRGCFIVEINVSPCQWKRVRACVCFAVTGIATAGSIAQDRVKAGLWEIAFIQDGAPGTSTYCITPEQAKIMNADAATVQVYVERAVSEENQGVCTLKNFKLEGNTLSLTKACGSGDSELTISLVRTYYGDTAETEVVSKAGGREMHIKSKQRRVGVCS